jgi:hypothetical protein
MYMWSREAPVELVGTGKRGAPANRLYELTVGAVTNPRAMDPFKEVVLRLWRASNSPDAQPSKLQAVETLDAIEARSLRMREIVGLPKPGAPVMTSSLSSSMLNLGLRRSTEPTNAGSVAGAAAAGGGGGRGASSAGAGVAIPGGVPAQPAPTAGRGALIPVPTAPFQHFASNAGVTRSGSATVLSKAPLSAQLHTPFNPRELLWTANYT